MKLRMTVMLLAVLLLASCGGRDATNLSVQSALVPAAVLDNAAGTELFNAALPAEGEFNPVRVPAVSSLSLSGSEFNEASANVVATGLDAEYAPAGASEYAIWRFAGTPQDSVGSVQVDYGDGGPGTSFWIAVADYSTGRWDWLGHAAEGDEFLFQLNGSAGQHSSPAGYIYVAVLADSDVAFSVYDVAIEYLQRYDVSGVVLDMQDQPLGMALITTNLLDSEPVLSGPGGTFTLNGIPNGSWTVMVALDGYQFSPAMVTVNVADANVEGLELRGNPQVSGWVGDDPYEPNNLYDNASDTGGTPPTATISILDDPVDFYQFPVPDQGWYYIQYEGDDSILFPSLYLHVDSFISTVSSSSSAYGANWVGYYFPRAGNYEVELTCEGGGGTYSLSLHAGQTQTMSVYLGDDGSPGDGDDGLYEEMYLTTVEIAYDDVKGYVTSYGTGTAVHNNIPPVVATITPLSPLYNFDPPFVEHDFSTGPLVSFDFNVSAAAPVDSQEPNNDFADASVLSLPMAEPLEGWIGGFGLTNDDSYDFYKFEVQGGKHLMARVRFPENGPNEYPDAGYIDLYDESENPVSTDNYSGFTLHKRTTDPLAAGTYFLRVFMEGPVMRYELELTEFEPRTLSAQYMLDGEALDFGICTILTADQSYDEYQSVSDGLCDFTYKFMDGERVLVQHERHGLVFDPPTEWVVFEGSDITLAPQISYGTDSNEVNDFAASSKELMLPVDITASISNETDFQDFYEIHGLDGEELEIFLEPVDADMHSELSVTRISNGSLVFSSQQQGNLHCYIKAENADDYRFIVRSRTEGSSEYRLRIREATVPVYKISGSVDPGVVGETTYNTMVVNHTTGIAVFPQADSYNLGWQPAGSYQIEWQASNKNITPSGKTTINLTTADVVQDFSATYVDHDFGEPNDNSGAAYVLSIPASFHASLDDDNDAGPGNDRTDYYKFTAASDGIFEITVQPAADWAAGFRVELAQDTWSSTVNSGKRNPITGEQLIRFPVIAGKTYYINVGDTDDLEYDLTAGYVF
ncbi:MAG: carboxypeptidase regulatory-like domain-containing protein [Planctomycetales bacterium]|nr:carboxypeptidase regulatory-like domain-containing protein [bacterium]UNM09677.1 MAG: carboxypeptidase regulatory-like domain-containing protein [Planctomycetales bacterium]